MAASKYNFTIEQGATFSLAFQLKDSAGVPIDITGSVARMQFRPQPSSNVLYFEATLENGFLTIDAEEGKVTLNIDSETTADFKWTSAFYDLELEAPNGVVTRWIAGYIENSFEVTK
jgi:hypothetical protein